MYKKDFRRNLWSLEGLRLYTCQNKIKIKASSFSETNQFAKNSWYAAKFENLELFLKKKRKAPSSYLIKASPLNMILFLLSLTTSMSN